MILSLEGLPKIPQKMISVIGTHIGQNRNLSTTVRKTFSALINGAVPVTFFDKEAMLLVQKPDTDGLVQVMSEDFDSISLNLLKKPERVPDYNSIFIDEIRCLKRMNAEANEATLRGLFWNNVITKLISKNCGDDQFGSFELSLEWRTLPLFSDLESRIIDYAALVEVGDLKYPILQVEMGIENFNVQNYHKDQSKMFGTMSRTCINLSRAMAQSGKDPKDARIYGIWIGGKTVQFCVAVPILTKLPDGKTEIHAHLVFEDSWSIQMFVNAPENLDNFTVGEPSEEFVSGRLNLDPFPFTVTENQGDIALPEPPTTLPSAARLNLEGQLNNPAMMMLENFIKIVISRIEVIHSSSVPQGTVTDLGPIGDFVKFVQSRSGSTSQTPYSQKVKQSHAGADPSSPTDRVKKTKKSQSELKILLKLSKFPHLFPQLFEYQVEKLEDSSEMFTYSFEELEPIASEHGAISERLDLVEDHEGIILNCLLFGIQTLYGLHVLHESVKVVHSDISPRNIMFSTQYNTWKLNDFDHSMGINESLIVQRTAGTRQFIAPEAEETGIYTTSSDVFSLGAVMNHYINPVIMGRVFRLKDVDEEIEPNPHLFWFGQRILAVVRSMYCPNPNERPSVLEALCNFFNIFDEFIDYTCIEYSNEILKEARMCIELYKMERQEVSKEEEQEKEKELAVKEVEKKVGEIELKKPRLSIEERDAIISQILPVPQGHD